MVQLTAMALATPRWSVRGQTETELSVVPFGMAPAAGLDEAGRMVSVGPPLLASALREALRLDDEFMLPLAVKPQDASSAML